MNTINVENCKTLLIGRRGENEVTTVLFDFTEWASEFGSGVVDLYVKRFVDESAYPVVLTIDGTVASWLVTETDTNVAGYGKAEYVYRVDGKIAKSAVFPFFVAEDIGQPASEPPDPYESWLEQLTALGAETEAHAQAAEQSAENAAESAEDAAQSAASAEGYAGQAETAAGLAQAAQTASEAAMDAAQTAQASAESSATAASGSAASAAGSATAAAGSASDASSSASAAGASATTASTAAGQAEAAKTAAQTAQSAAEDAAEDAQQAAQQAHVEYEQLSGEVDDLSDEVSQQKSAINTKAGILRDTVSGSIASFIPDRTIPDLLGVTVDIEPVQAGSGDPSPDNVRPISGWDSVEVERTGKNLLDVDSIGEVTVPASGVLATRNGYVFEKAGTYTVKANGTGTSNYIYARLLSSDGTYGTPYYIVAGDTVTTATITVPSGSVMLLYDAIPDTLTVSKEKFVNWKVQVEVGNTASAYAAYDGISAEIALGQTVYGGTLDLNAGALAVDRAMVTLDGTESGWEWFDLYKQAYISDALSGTPAKYASDLVTHKCNILKPINNSERESNIGNFSVLISNGSGVGFSYSTDGTLEGFKAFAQANPIQLCYELATPIEIQLDPVTIAAIAGQTNNVWADAGDVTVEYAADIKAYIDRMNQPTEDDMIANTLIAANKYFTVNNRLFLSTASIAAGAMIIPGTNCTETSLAAALNALNA